MAFVPYIVRQGDYLAKLASRMGFDARQIWEHPKNKALREARDPNVLAPGDILFVPDTPPTSMDVQLAQSNAFAARVPMVSVAIVLRQGNDVMRDEPFLVLGLGQPLEGRSDGVGTARFDVPIDVQSVELCLPAHGIYYRVGIGHLDPVDTVSGQRARLANLGFHTSSLAPHLIELGLISEQEKLDADDAMYRDAVREFQRVKGIDPSGIADVATQRALKAAHGS